MILVRLLVNFGARIIPAWKNVLTKPSLTSELITLTVSDVAWVRIKNICHDSIIVYLVHWPIPMNPSGNHPVFPTLPNGKRDIDHSWDLKDTWKQMEAVLKKGMHDIATSKT